MKYYIISGEASGDLHGANMIRHLKVLDTNADIRCWGGDKMEEQGCTLVKHYKDLAFMGFIEVIANIKTIFNNLDFCKQDILRYKPDVIIFIDYPGFNLRIAEFAKKQGFKTIYYISPQIWAWKESRVNKIKQFIDKMIVILPFEKDFYKKHAYDVDYCGHPLLDAIDQYKEKNSAQDFRVVNNLSNKPIIALLPGSRKQEIAAMLQIMLTIKSVFPDYEFVIAAAPSIDDSFYSIITNNTVKIVKGQTYALLNNAYAALVTSGTATLETALFKVPQVVCYKGNYFSYLIAKQLIKVKYISLVNLIADKPIVTELIQDKLTTQNLINELTKLTDSNSRKKIEAEYDQLIYMLGGTGASQRVAQTIWSFMQKN